MPPTKTETVAIDSTDAPNMLFTPPVKQYASPPAVEAESKPWEEWGEAKGHLPQFHPGKPPTRTRSGGIMPGTRKQHNKEHWKLAAAAGLCGWKPGQSMTEAEFDKAIEDGQKAH